MFIKYQHPRKSNNTSIMKNLTTLFKNSISTCFLLFLSIVSYGQEYNFTKVQQDEGLIMRRVHDHDDEHSNTASGVGLINFHSDTLPAVQQKFDYMYMRATPDDKLNNVVITNDGTMMINTDDDCANLRDMKENVEVAEGDSLTTGYPEIKLYVNGGIAATTGNGTITILSDQRFKKNIVPLENSLEVIRESNFVEFQYNNLSGVASNKKYYGILAQEMQQVLPSTIRKGHRKTNPTDKKATEFLMFNPNDLIYSGLNAIKELDKENQDLKDKVAELEMEVEKNKTLEQRVNELENMLTQLIEGKEVSPQNLAPRTTIGTVSSYLYQNQPNPSRNSTDIEYYLPNDLSTAQIVIQDLNGNKITEFNVQGAGMGKVSFNAVQFGITSGTYIYSLIANGRIIASKKMIFME